MHSEDTQSPNNNSLLIVLALSLVGIVLLGSAWKFISANRAFKPAQTDSSTAVTASPQASIQITTTPNATDTGGATNSPQPTSQPLVSKSKKSCTLLTNQEAESFLNANLTVYEYSGGEQCMYYTNSKVNYESIILILTVTDSVKSATKKLEQQKSSLTTKKVAYSSIEVSGTNEAIWIPSYSQLYLQKANAVLMISVTQSGGNSESIALKVANKAVGRL